MKAMHFIVPGIIALFLLPGIAFDQRPINHTAPPLTDTAIYPIPFPPGLDTIDFQTAITLDRRAKVQLLKFPPGGTLSSVAIFDHHFPEQLRQNNLAERKPLAEGDSQFDEPMIVDITTLGTGKFYVWFSSCHVGGIFPITIQ